MNGITLHESDHYEAVDVLKSSGNNITMVVGREVIVEREPEEEEEEEVRESESFKGKHTENNKHMRK